MIVGTARGLYRLGAQQAELAHPIAAIAADGDGWWALTEDGRLFRSGRQVATLSGVRGRCVLPVDGGAMVGTSEARVFHVDDGTLGADKAFDEAPGRETWYTPWGGPPDTRSLASDPSGSVYANVHVGGILRRTDSGAWEPTIDVDADVHQVTTGAGLVLAATAYGLATSADGGTTWETEKEGLHAPYCRAVAVAGETVVVTASTGPFTDRAAVYRGPVSGGALERCRSGLPEWFPANIDTHCLAASGSRVVLGTDHGDVWKSPDEGRTWDRVAEDLPAVRAVAFAS